MNHSFLFFLFLVLLVVIATAVDFLSWRNTGRVRRKRAKPQPVKARIEPMQGSVADRRTAG